MIKKITTMLIAVAMLASVTGVFCACGGQEDNKYTIVTTGFSAYDWARELVGDNDGVEIICLSEGGVDMHSFQPSVDDVVKVSSCDLFIYVGGDSETWVEDALKQKTNSSRREICLTELLSDSLLCNHDHDHEEEGDHDHEHAKDEHVWLSLKLAVKCVDQIASVLSTAGFDGADEVTKSAEAYKQSLVELDGQYQSAVESASVNVMVFCDRFPFRYLLSDYGISHYSAFTGCSAESEASFETIMELAQAVDSHSLDYVITIEGSKHDIAATVINSTESKSAQILTLNSLQSVTRADIEGGLTYLSAMQKNLETVKKALGAGEEV